MTERLPESLLLAYYGDDFTGSTDAMEAMTAAGLPTVLFLEPPTPAQRARFPQARCIGLAGASRSRDPAWMDAHLPAAFDSLAALGAPLLQYKVCSTFDSSPQIGSIGRAIDIGVPRMRGGWSPMVIGAPRLRRYQAFGTLFAAVDGVAYRLDRHPTMSRHPVTPMGEADLRLHLSRQTARQIELIDLVQLRAGEGPARLMRLEGGPAPVTLIDVLDEETLLEAGRLVWERRGPGLFTASSSGLQYALAAYWRSRGWLPATPSLPVAGAVDAILAVSGSCSPVTARQLAWARDHGFHTERLRIERALDAAQGEREIERCVRVAAEAVGRGQSVVVFSAEGPDDPAVTGFDAAASAAGLDRAAAAQRVGMALARVMRRGLDTTGVRRAAVAGGDSSGEVTSALAVDALTIVAGLAPGAPLCRCWSADPRRDGLELVLKGGQMGAPSFFADVVAGRAR